MVDFYHYPVNTSTFDFNKGRDRIQTPVFFSPTRTELTSYTRKSSHYRASELIP